MATVLIQHGDVGPDGTPPPRAYFQLIEGKLHMPTIRDYFRLANVALDGVVYPTGPDGFTFSTFAANMHVRVTGDPLPGGPRLTRVLLIRTGEVYSDADQPGGKRKVTQMEENLGLWTLPPPEAQPRTLQELASALRSYLQIEHSITWLFKYRYQNELVPIVSDSALAGAFDYFRAQAAQGGDDELGANQQCRLYLYTLSEEMAPRDIIRARIEGILDAAAAHSLGRESNTAAAQPQQQQQQQPVSAPPSLPASITLPGVEGGGAVALLSSHQQHAATAAAAALAAAGFPYGLSLATQPSETVQQDGSGGGGYGGLGGGDLDGEDGEEDGLGEGGGPMTSLLGIQRPSGSEGMGMGMGGPGGTQIKKESKTRHADGRFKNESQHNKKMADMSRKIAELFDGQIVNMVEVADHKKIMCLLCNHACTAYSAYHTDCVRKHFLRHHENMLRDRGVDVARWRKEYEVSQKVKRQQQQNQQQGDQAPGAVPLMQPVAVPSGHMQTVTVGNLLAAGAPGGGLQQLALPAGLLFNGLNVLQGAAGGGGGGEGDNAQRSLQAQLLSLAGVHVPIELQLPVLTQHGGGSGNGSSSSGAQQPGGVMPTVSALLLQAQNVSQDEQLQIQAAGALSGLMTAASVSGGGAPPGTAGSLVSQLSGALGGNPAPMALVPMARMASGTVTTEMPLPPPPLPPSAQVQVTVQNGGESLLHEVGPLGLTRSASAASQGHGSLSSIRSPPVVTTDMVQPPAC